MAIPTQVRPGAVSRSIQTDFSSRVRGTDRKMEPMERYLPTLVDPVDLVDDADDMDNVPTAPGVCVWPDWARDPSNDGEPVLVDPSSWDTDEDTRPGRVLS